MEAQFLGTLGGTPSGPCAFRGFRPEGMESITTKNFNCRHEIARGRNKARIIQSGAVSKGLREDFSFTTDRRDDRGAIRMK
ncbi:hypothetical protein E2C01_086283 [Portunus trituberculatus]|uniref:Uncharacterized protein n=1 Tax=Portunus trituberculatus TaxID=210409 RepID=A0A5B7J8V8_PORTR|nr:hypothetical protein [Portunus trituberculatus]